MLLCRQAPSPYLTATRSEDSNQKGYRVFSNVDAVSFFYQFWLDPDSAKRNFAIYALNKIYVLLRMAQGCSVSPQIAQSIISKCMSSHPLVKAFLDDLTCFSGEVDKHIEKDLPRLFALCSFYNVLLNAKKCEFVRDSCRILGHQISEEQLTLLNDKIEKLNDRVPQRQKILCLN